MNSIFNLYFLIGFFLNAIVVERVDTVHFEEGSKEYKKSKIAGKCCAILSIVLFAIGLFL